VDRPARSRRLINGNDGGDHFRGWRQELDSAVQSADGAVLSRRRGQPLAYRIYGAQQDNTTIAIASRDDEGVIGRQDWYEVGGGESGYIAPDPGDRRSSTRMPTAADDPLRSSHRQPARRLDTSLDVSGNGAQDLEYRIQWTEPVFVSARFESSIHGGAIRAEELRSGKQLRRISADLTRNDKSKQRPSGGPITLDITSVEYYDTVFALAESRCSKAAVGGH